MPLTRLYITAPFALNTPIMLSASHSQHVCKVMRLNEGEQLIIFNAAMGEYIAELQHKHHKQAIVVPKKQNKPPVENPKCQLHLIQAVSRGDRMDYSLQKATELGVNAITPIITERCGVKLPAERMQKKIEHWQNVIISATQQCGRLDVPQLNKPITFAEWIQQPKAGTILACLPTETNDTFNKITDPQLLSVLIGPEAGFSNAEISVIKDTNIIPWQLGPRILRTETAGVVALSLLQYQFGDFQ